jgi:5-methylcytosine-specific restriction protein A
MSDGWSKEELRASVDAYVEMQRKERQGQPFTKKRYYEELAAKFRRQKRH